MMKRRKAFSTLFLAGLLLTTTLLGCGSSSNPGREGSVVTSDGTVVSTASTESAAINDPFKEHYDISLAFWNIDQSLPKDVKDPLYDLLCQKFNINITPVNTTWDDAESKIKLLAATQDLPDVWGIDVYGTPTYQNWVSQGIMRPVPDDLSKYPSIQADYAKSDASIYQDKDGKYYFLFRRAYSEPWMWSNDRAIVVRKDWADQLGFTKDPENMDEFITMMKTMAEKNPEGKKNVVGLTLSGLNFITMFFSAYEPGIANDANQWIEEDGKLIPASYSKNVLAGIKELKKLYNSGGLDKDFSILKGDEGLDKFASGNAAAIVLQAVPLHQKWLYDKWNQNFPDKKYADSVKYLHMWRNADGNYYRYEKPSVSQTYFNAKLDDKKFDRILSFFDYLKSEEGKRLQGYGLEGVDYKMDGSKVVITRPIDTATGSYVALESKYPYLISLGWLADWRQEFAFEDPSFDQGVSKKCNELLTWWKNNGTSVKTDPKLLYLSTPSKDTFNLDSYTDDIIKTVLSSNPDKTWASIRKDWESQGIQKVIDEVNKQAGQ